MPSTTHHISQIVRDLKSSNYFRIWAALWIGCFIGFFFGLVNFAHLAEEHHAQSMDTDFVVMPTVPYPNFHFKLPGTPNAPAAMDLEQVNCVWNGTKVLKIQPCMGLPPFAGTMTNCFAVVTHNTTFSAYATAATSSDLFVQPNTNTSIIRCNFTVDQAMLNTTPNWVGFDIDSLTDFDTGDNSFGSVWFDNAALQVVYLSKYLINGVSYWNRDRSPHFTNTVPTINITTSKGIVSESLFQTFIVLDTTTVQTYQTVPIYSEWQALADAGGYAFALWIMHKILMMIVGLFLANDSAFLGGLEHNTPATATASETSPLTY